MMTQDLCFTLAEDNTQKLGYHFEMKAPSTVDPVQSLLAWLEADMPRTLIALVGIPGSGKSTLAARLAAEVNAQAGAGTMVALGMDGFHLSKAVLSRLPDPEVALARRGAPWTFDAQSLGYRLQRLSRMHRGAEWEAVPWPEFRHEIGDPVEDAQLIPPETRLILVEGLYLLCRSGDWRMVSLMFDERWFLDTPLDVSLERLTRRHMAVWGMTRAEAEARVAANDRLNAEIVLRSREFADVWIK